MVIFKKRLGVLFGVGFLLGPVGDYCHLISHTTAYPLPAGVFSIGGIPLWVPFLFGAAAVAVGWSHPVFDRWFHRVPSGKTVNSPFYAWGGVLLFLALYCVSGFLPWTTPGGDDIFLACCALGIWKFLDGRLLGFFLALLTAFTGSFVEISLVHFGIFSYLPPKDQLWGVATWLPSLYFAASVTLGNFGRHLLGLEKNKNLNPSFRK